jgi:hypothetical protein
MNQTECGTCGGEKTVPAMARVYPNEPHMADIDTEACPDCAYAT